MKKLVIVLAVIVVVAGAGLLYVGSQLDSIVAGLIEEHGSAATKTPVRVGGVSIQLAEATGAISSLSVGNPEGFPGNAIELGNFSLTLNPASLTSDTVVIEDVTVSGARLNIQQEGAGNNLRQLLQNLGAASPDDGDDSAESGKKLIIDQFTLAGASASLSVPDLGENREVELPTIRLRNIGSAEGGATGSEIARQVLKPVIEEALKSAAAQTLRDKATEKLQDAADSLLRGLGDALGGNEDPNE